MEEVTTMLESLSDDVFLSFDDRLEFDRDKNSARTMSSKLLTSIKPKEFKLCFNPDTGNLRARCLGKRGSTLREIEIVVLPADELDAPDKELALSLSERIGQDPMISLHPSLAKRIANHIPILSGLVGEHKTASDLSLSQFEFLDSNDRRWKNVLGQSVWRNEASSITSSVLSSILFEDLSANQFIMVRLMFEAQAIVEDIINEDAAFFVNKSNIALSSFRLVPRPNILESKLHDLRHSD